ncbi:MAG: hypothetical protein WAT92_23015 [Saprospiraceae bacterium]
MANSKVFNGVTLEVWDRIKTTSKKEHGTIYTPEGAVHGTVSTDTPVGNLQLGFDYDATKDVVTYTILKRPTIIFEDEIWEGTQVTINRCALNSSKLNIGNEH